MKIAPVHSVKNSFKDQNPKQVADTLKARSSFAGLLPVAVGIVSGFALDHTAFLGALDAVGHGITGLNPGDVSSGAEKISHVLFHSSGTAGLLVDGSMGVTTALGASVGLSEIWAGSKTHSYSLVGMGVLDLAASSVFPLAIAGLGVPAIGVAIGVGIAECVLAFSRKMSSVQRANSTFKMLTSWTGVAMLTGVAVAPAALAAGLTRSIRMLYLNNSKFRKKLGKLASHFRHSKSLPLNCPPSSHQSSETRGMVPQSFSQKQVFQKRTLKKAGDEHPPQDSTGATG